MLSLGRAEVWIHLSEKYQKKPLLPYNVIGQDERVEIYIHLPEREREWYQYIYTSVKHTHKKKKNISK